MTPEALVIRAVDLQRAHPSYRWGQSLYNALDEIAPQVATEVQGTPVDPFYDSANLPAFWGFLFGRLF